MTLLTEFSKKNSIQTFKREIWRYHAENRRDFAWRETHDPYHILVSELMLQQTQTSRVAVKYDSFLKKFPTIKALAAASLQAVLIEWQGLGYNRRAKYLKQAAEEIQKGYGGKFPKNYDTLLTLPGIGQSTAGALMAFAFNTPVVFIETNIRNVFIHFFFADSDKIHDNDIKILIEETMDQQNPREWYYALYDYGAHLKKSGAKLNAKSAHYKKQSAFKDSNRELRSNMLKIILKEKKVTLASLSAQLALAPEKLEKNLSAFEREGVLTRKNSAYIVR